MEKEKEGFPITSLREINTLLKAQHINIVTVRVRRPQCVNDEYSGNTGIILKYRNRYMHDYVIFFLNWAGKYI